MLHEGKWLQAQVSIGTGFQDSGVCPFYKTDIFMSTDHMEVCFTILLSTWETYNYTNDLQLPPGRSPSSS